MKVTTVIKQHSFEEDQFEEEIYDKLSIGGGSGGISTEDAMPGL